jgi:hypothetical protein
MRDAFGIIPNVARCSACEKPLLGFVTDASGRCCSCITKNARAVDCDCGFLVEGEACACSMATSQELAS